MRTEAPRAPLRLGAVILPGAAGQCGLRVPARRAGAGTAPPGQTGGSAALRSLSCGDSVVSHSLRAGRHAPAAPSTALSGGWRPRRRLLGFPHGAVRVSAAAPGHPETAPPPGTAQTRRRGSGGSCARYHCPPRASRAGCVRRSCSAFLAHRSPRRPLPPANL